MTDEENVARVDAAVAELNRVIREVCATGINIELYRDNVFPPDVKGGCPFPTFKLTRAERLIRYRAP